MLTPIIDLPLVVKTISADTTDYNQKTAHSQSFVSRARTVINSGVVVGSTSTATASYDTGTGYPTGSVPELVNNGKIYGKGGAGGAGGVADGFSAGNGSAGSAGGPALKAQVALRIYNNSEIRGGCGGGGGSGGQSDGGGSIGGGGNGGGGGQGSQGGAAGSGTAGLTNTGNNGTAGSSSAAGSGGAQYTLFGGNLVIDTGGAGGSYAGSGAGATGGTGQSTTHFNDTTGGSGGALGNCTTTGSNALINWLTAGTRTGTLG